MTTAGDLNRRVVVERATEAAGPYGETVKTWGTVATIWARREDVSDGEMIAAGELGAYLAARFTVRRSATTEAITARDRLTHDGATWNIQAVREKRDEALAFLEIRAVREA